MKNDEYNIILTEYGNGYLVFDKSFPIEDWKVKYRPFGYYLVEFANICKLGLDEKIKKIMPYVMRLSELEEKIPIIEKRLLEFLSKEMVDLIIFDYVAAIKNNDEDSVGCYDDEVSIPNFFQFYFHAIFRFPEEFLKGYNDNFIGFIKKNLKNDFSFYDQNWKVYTVCSINQIITLLQMEKNNFSRSDYKAIVCGNCGRYFLTETLKSRYCDNISPQDEHKTCRDFVKNIMDKEYQKNSTVPQKLYSKVYKRLQIALTRHPDNEQYADKFEDFKIQAQKWKTDVKEGKVTEKEYLDWLKSL